VKLKKMSVTGLFGLFNHEVPFNLEDRLTLIHAPNGFGKTVILKLISAFFGGSLSAFREYEYRTIIFEFDVGDKVTIDQIPVQTETAIPARRRVERTFKITYEDGAEQRIYDSEEWRSSENLRNFNSPSSVERFIPQLHRTATDRWYDSSRGDTLSLPEVVERYDAALPRSVRSRVRIPEWLEQVRGAFNCRLINTQRLYTTEKTERHGQSDETTTLTVKTYSSDLATQISRTLATGAVVAQVLDQTFPNRILASMKSVDPLPSEHTLRTELSELVKRREQLASVGLLDSPEASDLMFHDQFDDNTRRLFTVYIDDTSRKLHVYADMLAKLQLFVDILNSRLQFKPMIIDKEAGFKFIDRRNKRIAPEHLSSGEQHELVLNFDLLFKSEKNTLILIDEPEISLHIAWQKRFIPDLERIIQLTGIDAVLCTHSPQLVGGYMNLAVQLRGPDDAQFDD
jgi:predicted ATP-binding protein involved in virulence